VRSLLDLSNNEAEPSVLELIVRLLQDTKLPPSCAFASRAQNQAADVLGYSNINRAHWRGYVLSKYIDVQLSKVPSISSFNVLYGDFVPVDDAILSECLHGMHLWMGRVWFWYRGMRRARQGEPRCYMSTNRLKTILGNGGHNIFTSATTGGTIGIAERSGSGAFGQYGVRSIGQSVA